MHISLIRSKSGPRPKGKVKIEWSPNFAYAIGLIASDGNLSSDGRHIDFTSKDKEQILNYKKCLGLDSKIGKKIGKLGTLAHRVQFGDVIFYDFLLNIGLMSNKSKILSALDIPDAYFFDFLRGSFDGDGSFYSYWDKRWKSSFMFYMTFSSASKEHIFWLRNRITRLAEIYGHISKSINDSCYQLRFAKREALLLIKKIYYSKKIVFLKRKFVKIQNAIWINQ